MPHDKRFTSSVEEKYRAFVDRLFVKKRDGDDGKLHAAVGLAGESGEVLDHVKKTWVYGRPLDHDKMLEEAGDVFHYFQMLCIAMGWTWLDVINNNMEKLQKRYPDGYTDQAAIKRADHPSEATSELGPGRDHH